MLRLTEEQIQIKLDQIDAYTEAKTASDGSLFDANANVTQKTAVSLDAEITKDIKIQVNRALIKREINEAFGSELADQYISDLESHLIYTHDETSLLPYCVSINMYPFLLKGMESLSESATASSKPEHLRSFCGSYVNLVQYVASNYAGAVATTEFLMYFDYFARKDFGDKYLETHSDIVAQELQGVIFLLNQDTAARGGQCIFSNIATFDKYFFEGIFGDFMFPDMTKPSWDSLEKLQEYWHVWFRKERTKKLLTFPVVTHCAIANEEESGWKDQDSADFIAKEMSLGGEFFIYTSPTADSLASCCRLRNEIGENDFSYSLGAGGVATGSKNVITLNVNRMYQTAVKLEDIVARIHKYQVAFNNHFAKWVDQGLLPVFTSGMISLEDQFSTIGVNGVLEGAEYLGYNISNNPEYTQFLCDFLGKIKALNKQATIEYGCKFNTEFVPAENLGVKNANWDKKDGLIVPRDCYNSYMYIVEDEMNILDKMDLHGGKILGNLDGGSALHWNLDEHLTVDQYGIILKALVIKGSNYFCVNVKKTCCNDCNRITAETSRTCPKCGSPNVDYATRVIGYLKKVKNFAKARRIEEGDRDYDETKVR